MIRLYYNRRGTLPWSVDYGDQASEVTVRAVHLEGVSGESRTNPRNRNPKKPSAWLELQGAQLTIRAGEAYISLET